MIGPVLHQELLLGGRRNRLHVLRWVYAGWLVVQVIYLFIEFHSEQAVMARMRMFGQVAPNQASAPEVVGGRFAELFVRQQLLFLVLLTPAFVAGAIADEKRRGTLQYLLTTDLESRHILLGKLLGRVAQVALVMLAGLPLFALLAGFGGIEPVTILTVAVALVVPTFALASATLLASVWCRETRDAVLAFYVAGVAGGLAVYLLGGPLRYLDPLYVLAPAWGPAHSLELAEMGRRLLGSVLAWGALGGLCLGVAVGRMRSVYIRELKSSGPTRATWYHGDRAPIGDDPVRWRERHVEGLAPNATLRRLPQWLGITGVALVTLVSSCLILYFSLAPGAASTELLRALFFLNPRKAAALLPDAGNGFLYQAVIAMLLASLVVGVRCSGAVTGERERQSWEALLLTPVSARQIVRGKLWGVMAASYWYLLAYAAPAVVLSVLGGPLALVWTVLWLAVTVLAMYFVGATGLYCSTAARNSWRSLLSTLAVGYVGGTLIFLVTSPVIVLVALLLALLLYFIDLGVGTTLAALCFSNFSTFVKLFYVASCLGLAVIFWLMARLFVTRAQRYIADRERTRHWYDEPLYRRPRRALSGEGPPRPR